MLVRRPHVQIAVGEVAAPAAGDADLLGHFFGVIDQQHLEAALACLRRTKQAGSTGAYDDSIKKNRGGRRGVRRHSDKGAGQEQGAIVPEAACAGLGTGLSGPICTATEVAGEYAWTPSAGGYSNLKLQPMNTPSHQLSMTVLMSPDMANFSGNVHGGAILKLLDQVAYACASRYAGRYVVTLSVDQVMFLQPIHVGELVTFLSSVNHTGKSSMEIGIKVVAEDIRSQVVRHVNSCFFTMVAVDDDKKPALVPPLEPQGDEEKRRWQAAIIRKELRKDMAERFAQIRVTTSANVTP